MRGINTRRVSGFDIEEEGEEVEREGEGKGEVVKDEKVKGGGRVGKLGMNVVDPEIILKDLEMTKEEFIDFALLCGTDFTDRIPRLVYFIFAFHLFDGGDCMKIRRRSLIFLIFVVVVECRCGPTNALKLIRLVSASLPFCLFQY